jgi:hypothetical protein
MDHHGGERGSSILRDIAFRVIEEERVAPSDRWCPFSSLAVIQTTPAD